MSTKPLTLPNFLIIGAAKSGTNSLGEYLRLHPQVFMYTLQEPCFFAYEDHPVDNPWDRPDAIANLEEYACLFENAGDKKAIGESSPVYLISPQAPVKIKKYLAKPKLIAILRNPVDRAYSQWQMEIRHGHEQMEFAQAVHIMEKLRDGTIRQRYIYQGFYYQQLKRYYDIFDRTQILVLLLDDLQKKPHETIKRMYAFLGVDSNFEPDFSVQKNEGGIPRNRMWDWFFKNLLPYFWKARERLPERVQARLSVISGRVKAQALTKPPRLSNELRAELTGLFREDILQLQDLIKVDLSLWLMDKPNELTRFHPGR